MYECPACERKEETLNRTKEFLESIVNMLYSNKPLNLIEFENDLDELCHRMDVQIGFGDLQIQRKETKTITMPTILPMVEQWINFNNQYLAQLTN